jgi:AmiR/NasT family two-component response regulator
VDGTVGSKLRILVADTHEELLRDVVATVSALGHEVLEETDLARVGEVTAAQKPDVAMVVVRQASANHLEMIGKIVHESACPVIAILDVQDRDFIQEAAKRGIFAYLTGGEDPQELQSSIDIVLRRFAEYHNLEGAFGRRAVTERAKGILMERHGLDEQQAFELLRRSARRTNRKIVDMAEAILAAHSLLPSSRPMEREPKGDPEALGEEL